MLVRGKAVEMIVAPHQRAGLAPKGCAAMGIRLLGVELLLAHEMPGIDQDERHGIEFASFFRSTPQRLLDAGIYVNIAVPLRGAAFRPVSLAMLAQKLGAAQPARVPSLVEAWRWIAGGAVYLWPRVARPGRGALLDGEGVMLELEMHSGRHSRSAREATAFAKA